MKNKFKQIKYYQESLFSSFPPKTKKNDFKSLALFNSVSTEGEISHMSKFKPFHSFQKPLVVLSKESFLDYIETIIPKEHLTRLVKEVVDKISIKDIMKKYSFRGQKTYPPTLLLRILFYGYATGVRSSRKLSEKCLSDHFYIYLMEGYTPDHRTISDFRKNNIKEIEKYFVEILWIFRELKIIQIGKIYIDGTKIKANASVKRTKDEQNYEKWLLKVKEEITKLMKELDEIEERENQEYKVSADQAELLKKMSDKKYLQGQIEEVLLKMKSDESLKKLNLTDNDANNMKPGSSKDIRPSYNCQASVTEDGIIVAAEASLSASDKNQLEPLIKQSENNIGIKIEEVAADSGYDGYDNYEYLDKNNIDGYIPDSDFKRLESGIFESADKRYHHSNFKYDKENNYYLCPEGKKLTFYKFRKNAPQSRNKNKIVYRGIECHNCASRSLCTKEKARSLAVDTRKELLIKMREKLSSEQGKLKYQKRMHTIEPVFGHLKFNLGYKHFFLRGYEKVNAELNLMAIGWNLKKLFSFIQKSMLENQPSLSW